MSDKPVKVQPELEDVATQIGEFIEYWGFKNVHGRIWAHLFLSATPLDAADLIERLQISKALVSMSLSELAEYDVVQTAGKSLRGTITYIANPNVTSVVTGVLRKRERRMLARIAAATKVLKEHRKQVGVALSDERIDTMDEMVKAAEMSLDAILNLNEVDLAMFKQFDGSSAT